MQQGGIWAGKSGNAYVAVRYELEGNAPALPAVCLVSGAGGRGQVLAVLAVDDARAAFGKGGAMGAGFARRGADAVHLWFDVGHAPLRDLIAADLQAALGPFGAVVAPAEAGRSVA